MWLKDGRISKELKGHYHWVNTISLNTDSALKRGCCDEKRDILEDEEDQQKRAAEIYSKLKGKKNEKLVSGSDDNTVIMWDP